VTDANCRAQPRADGLLRSRQVCHHSASRLIMSVSSLLRHGRGGCHLSLARALPNTTILVPGIGSVTLNEQTCDGGGAPPCSGTTSSGVRVRAIHLIVDNPNALGVPQGADVIVGEAHADSSHP
jgi:hypothetical protein